MGRLFDEAFPTALAMGMTPEQYWSGDPMLYAAYREARRRSDEARAWDQWTLGMYVYDAVLRASPVLNPFSGRRKAFPWLDEPYQVSERRAAARTPEDDEREAHERMIAWMLGQGPRN